VWKFGLAVLFAVVSVALVSAAKKRTLVLSDNWTIRETHSIFFKTLRGKHDVMGVGRMRNCGMRKVKCGIKNCGNGCGMVGKTRNAERVHLPI